MHPGLKPFLKWLFRTYYMEVLTSDGKIYFLSLNLLCAIMTTQDHMYVYWMSGEFLILSPYDPHFMLFPSLQDAVNDVE